MNPMIIDPYPALTYYEENALKTLVLACGMVKSPEKYEKWLLNQKLMDIKIMFKDGKIRTYNIQEELAEKVNDGHHLAIEICHPDFGEVMIAKILPREEYTNPLTI